MLLLLHAIPSAASFGSGYIPSPIEAAWTWNHGHGSTKTNCALIHQQQNSANTTKWLQLTTSAMACAEHPKYCNMLQNCERVVPHRPLLEHPESTLTSIFSQMPLPSQQDPCFSRYIEPLTGSLRHPMAFTVCGGPSQKFKRSVSDFNITYLALPSAHCRPECEQAKRREGRRTLFFDLGCAQYSNRNEGLAFKLANRASKQQNTTLEEEKAKLWFRHELKLNTTDSMFATGASIEPFFYLFQKHCLKFDHIWGWDPKFERPSWWWSRVPSEQRSKITFFNKSVDSTDAGEHTALGALRANARPEDYVVLKLDIDTPAVEEEILDIFLSEDGRKYTDLIDEFFFEYQGTIKGNYAYELDNKNTTVTEGIRMMQKLREMGIRAHFWV